jgi:CheY-like chemotaxis protein
LNTRASLINKPVNSQPCSLEKVKPKKILIVEDHAVSRKFLRQLLERRGHYCEEAQNGLIGLNMVRATLTTNSQDLYLRNYDAILMNLKMPVMNGHESTAEIRLIGYTGPIIGVTASSESEVEEGYFKAGATSVITKPFKMSLMYRVADL